MRIHWHRRDLRIADNPGLIGDGIDSPDRALPVFVVDPTVLEHAGPARVSFLLEALESLRESYRSTGSDLVIRHGDPAAVLPDVIEEFDVDTVSWGIDYSGLAHERDADVRLLIEDAGVPCETAHDAVCHEPGSIRTNDGDPYSVFTYFGRKWHDREKRPPAESPSNDELAEVSDDEPVPALDALGFDPPEAEIPTASTDAARQRLQEFCAADIYRYADRRDYPAAACTSRLSPHLKFGTIGIREVFEATERAKAEVTGEREESVREFQDQLAWREFYAQVLGFNPNVVTENYKEYAEPIAWRDDPAALQAWKDGETGYPIVDAGMRQLRAEAFMHNRVRMIVASFLTKDLLLDWRAGYEWFREKLVDHDTANDTGGWQWAASTGTDAQPYFRIFNPMTQAERYDPDGEYIREYVPELDGVPAETIHSWHELDEGTRDMHAPDYPAPIVDHSARREAALAMFERARGESA